MWPWLAAQGPSPPPARTRTPVVDAVVQEDDRLLERRPEGLVPLPIRVWLGVAS